MEVWKHLASAVFALIAVAGGVHLTLAAHAGGPPSAPLAELHADIATLYSAVDPEQPIWISSQAATAEDGSVDWSIVGESVRESYEGLKTWPSTARISEAGDLEYDPWTSQPIPGGIYWGPTHRHYVGLPADDTLDDLITNSRYIVRGTVVHRQQGFYDGEPASLLTLQVESLVRPADKARTPVTRTLYVAYPHAAFRIGEHGFYKGDPSYPPLPAVGDTVLLFHYTVALDAERTVFRPEADKILVQGASGELVVSPAWREHSEREVPQQLTDVMDRILSERHVVDMEEGAGS